MSNPNQGAATRERNEEIERRLTAGESGPALACAFGITQPRVFQIARAVREARGEVAPRAKPIRPRLRKDDMGLWECTDGTVSRRGETQKEAYDRWMAAATAAAQPAKAARQPMPDPMPAYAGPDASLCRTRDGRSWHATWPRAHAVARDGARRRPRLGRPAAHALAVWRAPRG